MEVTAWLGSKAGGECGAEMQLPRTLLGPRPGQEAPFHTFMDPSTPSAPTSSHCPCTRLSSIPDTPAPPAPDLGYLSEVWRAASRGVPRQPGAQGEEGLEPGGAGPGQGPESVCPSVQAGLTWHPLPLGLWTVNRSGNRVRTQASRGGGGEHDCLSSEKGVSGMCAPHPHPLSPRSSLHSPGGVGARRGWGAGPFPLCPSPSHICPRISQNCWCLQIPRVRIRGTGSRLLPNVRAPRLRAALPHSPGNNAPRGLASFPMCDPSNAVPRGWTLLSQQGSKRGQVRGPWGGGSAG